MRKLLLTLAVCAVAFAGCRTTDTPRSDPTPTLSRFFLENSDDRSGSLLLPRSGVKVVVGARPVLTEGDISNVELMQVDLGKCLMFQLTGPATRDLYRISASNQGRRLVLAINGETIGARRMEAPITDGMIYIFAEVPDEELPELVMRLKRSSTALQREIAKK